MPETVASVEVYRKKRVYAKEVASIHYTLTEERRQRLDTVPRVITPVIPEDHLEDLEELNIVAPDDEPFRTQSLASHFRVLPPGGKNEAHGHQNEALFYVLEGHGYELHDGVRYDWEKGDAFSVHNDCVHWHNNEDPDHRAVVLALKAKPLWLFLGLWQQGQVGTVPSDDDKWGPRQEWALARAPEDVALKKVIKPGDTPWELTPHGRIRRLADETVPLRVKAIDAYEQEIPAGSRSGRRWQMGDLLVYVLEGHGYDLHWDVETEITDQYYARIAKEPSRWDWHEGQMIWIPQNTVSQHFNADPSRTAKLLVATNRLFKHIGYSRIEELENAPEYEAAHPGPAARSGG